MSALAILLHPYTDNSHVREKMKMLEEFVQTAALYRSGEVFWGNIPLVW